jgi:hypothetical protein
MTDMAPQIADPSGLSSSEQKKQASLRRRILRVALIAFAVFFFAPYLLTLLYVFIDPPFSAPMLRQIVARSRSDFAEPHRPGHRGRGWPLLHAS